MLTLPQKSREKNICSQAAGDGANMRVGNTGSVSKQRCWLYIVEEFPLFELR